MCTLRNSFAIALAVGIAAVMPFAPTHAQVLLNDGALLSTSYSTNVGTSPQQRVPTTPDHRGVRLDGSVVKGSSFGWAIGGTGEGGCDGRYSMAVDAFTGSPSIEYTFIALPSAGLPWTIGVSYAAQREDPTKLADADSFQGWGWFQNSAPELVYIDRGESTPHIIHVVYGADRYLSFIETEAKSKVYRGINGAAGAIELTTVDTSYDVFVYTDLVGNKISFFGSVGSGNPSYQLWKMTTPAGKTSYVGDETSPSTAFSSYDNGRIAVAYDEEDRKYVYEYGAVSGGTKNRLKSVEVYRNVSGSYQITGHKVTFDYYGTWSTSAQFGDDGDLKTVTVTEPSSASIYSSGTVSNLITRTMYFRYNDKDISNNKIGVDHHPSLVVGFEGVRRFGSGYATAASSSLKTYSEVYYEYESTGAKKVALSFANGQCGACTGTYGDYTFTYEASAGYSDSTTSYDNEWYSRTIVTEPKWGVLSGTDLKTRRTKYFDEFGQSFGELVRDRAPTGDPGTLTEWYSRTIRDSDGRATHTITSEAVSAYTDTPSGSADPFSYNSSTHPGLVTHYVRYGSGAETGMVEAVCWNKGYTTSSPTNYVLNYTEYHMLSESIGGGAYTIYRPLTALQRVWLDNEVTWSGSPPSGGTPVETKIEYTDYSSASAPLSVETITTKNAKVDSSHNGSGTGSYDSVTISYLRKDGRVAFFEGADGVITYTGYAEGLLKRQIRDANTSSTSDFTSISTGDDPANWSGLGSSGSPVKYQTDYAYETLSRRLSTVTLPSGRVSYSILVQLNDKRLATIAAPRYVTGTPTCYGPFSYAVANLAGGIEISALLAVDSTGTSGGTTTAPASWINTGTSDPFDALHDDLRGNPAPSYDRSKVRRVQTSLFDNSGTRISDRRTYVKDLATSGTWTGTSGTDYDASTYAYDGRGLNHRTVDSTGTITRAVFDALRRPISSRIGTNDNGDPDGSGSGTNNMVETSTTTYDSGGSGNGRVTQRKLKPTASSGDDRVTTYAYDTRGRTLLTTNPIAPHILTKYDNLGRAVASGAYSSAPGSTQNPTSYVSGRVGLSETFYDERGQVYRAKLHKIDVSDGSDDDTLTTNNWYDPSGRLVKTAGSSITKSIYDRLGRPTNQFLIAKTNDSGYGDADDVSGDEVLEESQTVFDDVGTYCRGSVVLQVTIFRHHTDVGTTTGALDTDGDLYQIIPNLGGTSYLKGRAQIAAMWYDAWDRLTDTVQFGTNGGSTFTRYSSGSGWLAVPSRSDNELRTTIVYDKDGEVLDQISPRNITDRTIRDMSGRTTATIRNYSGASPPFSTADRDNDIYTRQTYSNGLPTKLWVDVDADGSEDSGVDQVTEYVYQSDKGSTDATSLIAATNLLHHVVYPLQYSGQSAAHRTVYFSYNALGEQKWTKDQNGTEITTTRDAGGRETKRTVATLGTNVDGAVRRVEVAYTTTRGQIDTITQYDATTSGNVTDQLKYSYDDWGNVTSFEQDVDSVVVSGSGRSAFNQVHTYTKVTPSGGWETVRRLETDFQIGGASKRQTRIQYESTGSYDDVVSRATRVQLLTNPGGPTWLTIASYLYMGSSSVVDQHFNEPDLRNRLHDGTTPVPVYTDYLDRFNRTIRSEWRNSTYGTLFYKVGIGYNRASSVQWTKDHVIPGFDNYYTLDGIDRLKAADGGVLDSSTSPTGVNTGQRTRRERWTDASDNLSLSQTGNWKVYRWEKFIGSTAIVDTGTFTLANELETRTLTGGASATVNYMVTPGYDAYDKCGQLVDDKENYKYEYDGSRNLVRVRSRGTGTPIVAEYRYNGLGYRIGWHYDLTGSGGGNPDGVVDSHDPWLYFAYNENWQQIALVRASDTNPHECFVRHQAGLWGIGSASAVDDIVLRERDTTSGTPTALKFAASGTLGERLYYCQNWRADVALIMSTSGSLRERFRYSAYGMPWRHLYADVAQLGGSANPDGSVTADDYFLFSGTYSATTTNGAGIIICDIAASGGEPLPDGAVGTDDWITFLTGFSAGGVSEGSLGDSSLRIRRGYAGYELDPVLQAGTPAASGAAFLYHTRMRPYDSQKGRWLAPDPMEYADGLSLYGYVGSAPNEWIDPFGMARGDGLGPACAGGACKPCIPSPGGNEGARTPATAACIPFLGIWNPEYALVCWYEELECAGIKCPRAFRRVCDLVEIVPDIECVSVASVFGQRTTSASAATAQQGGSTYRIGSANPGGSGAGRGGGGGGFPGGGGGGWSGPQWLKDLLGSLFGGRNCMLDCMLDQLQAVNAMLLHDILQIMCPIPLPDLLEIDEQTGQLRYKREQGIDDIIETIAPDATEHGGRFWKWTIDLRRLGLKSTVRGFCLRYPNLCAESKGVVNQFMRLKQGDYNTLLWKSKWANRIVKAVKPLELVYAGIKLGKRSYDAYDRCAKQCGR